MRGEGEGFRLYITFCAANLNSDSLLILFGRSSASMSVEPFRVQCQPRRGIQRRREEANL